MEELCDYQLADWLICKGIRAPNRIFPGEWLDPVWAKELGVTVPLITYQYAPRYPKLPGCYAWCDIACFITSFEVGSSEPFVAYVGKAVNLKARLYHHWNNGSLFLWEWADQHPYGWYPHVVCWFTPEEHRAAMESELIRILEPRFNRRRE